jgi:hypothetical protein
VPGVGHAELFAEGFEHGVLFDVPQPHEDVPDPAAFLALDRQRLIEALAGKTEPGF